MADEKYVQDEEDIITLEFEDGSSIQCEIMGVFDCDDHDYIALIPEDGSDDVYIYAYQEYDDGTFEINDIEDDKVFEKAVREFEKIMEENEEEEEEEEDE
ncbi:MAG: DUF1292 domain-containing protein [Anaerovoracaceae bacterium]